MLSGGGVAEDGCHTVDDSEVVSDHDSAAEQQRVACERVGVTSGERTVDECGGDSALGDRCRGLGSTLDPECVAPELFSEVRDGRAAPVLTVGERLLDRGRSEPLGEMRIVAGARLNRDDGEAVGVEMLGDDRRLAIITGQDDEVGVGMDGVLGDASGDRVGIAFLHFLRPQRSKQA